ncbi:polysaccharide deacetylase family protein [Lederbergia lenta]|uniref:Polysaccharide deacetylase n=1 Tax=Lederbergia lenta TaxID=1467 RepID=A0A2X4W7C0_LEDLE|nr:polysaccharide deacetylase family protein [Lederbergia lenta]MEC2324140.1 polysaccharide deacetylase family protein [Lederbergia lenta]SQI60557.1 polysaccharide deacetylase [Lederbergia lenta]
MKKFIIMLAVIFILSACGSQPTTVDKSEDEPKQETANNQSEQSNDKQEIEKTDKEEKPETTEENEKVETKPTYRMNENTFALEPITDANPKVALITIDDAPDKYALEMAKTLKALDAPAIFFVNGHFIHSEEKEEIIKQIHELGFTIGNHTYSHADLKTLSIEEQNEEIMSVSDKVEEIIGERPKFFRAPFGSNTDESRQLASEEKMLLMNWTYGYDWESQYMTKDALADIMVNTDLLQDGANLLMHDREWTNAALEQIVNGLREKGYELLDPALIETPSQG